MPFSSIKDKAPALPDGYATIGISEDQEQSALRITAVVKLGPDPIAGHLITLKTTTDAKVYLGGLVDKSGTICEWLEIWVQTADNLHPAKKHNFSNAILDRDWINQVNSFTRIHKPLIINTDWQTQNPLPTLLDIDALRPLHPLDNATGNTLELCKDEGLLQSKSLPAYGSSLARYLYTRQSPESPMIAVSKDACDTQSEKLLDLPSLIPFNPQAGMVMIKKHIPLPLENYIDVLSGLNFDGTMHGRETLKLCENFAFLNTDNATTPNNGRLFTETFGKSQRITETLYLKLCLLADAVLTTRDMTAALQRPLFNITPAAFDVQLGNSASMLPFLWTASASINDTGVAMPLPIKNSNLQYYVPATVSGPSIYSPAETSIPAAGHCSIRIRQVATDDSDTTIVDGTFSTYEKLTIAENDLISINLALANSTTTLYARLTRDEAMAPGEWRFNTIDQNLPHEIAAQLQQAKGVPLENISFAAIKHLSSPCDLYSLGVLAVRMLLVNNDTSLPVALDAVLSLARRLSEEATPPENIEKFLQELFEKDPRWVEALSPNHLTKNSITPSDACAVVPLTIWLKAMSIIVRMFPGKSPNSYCKHYGDAIQGGIARVFDPVIDDLNDLLTITRTFIVPDTVANTEISSVIEKFMK